MRRDNRMIKKATAVSLSLALALSAGPVIDAGAKAKAPTLSKKSITLDQGKKKKLTVKANGVKITKTTWSSKNKKVATVSKKGVVKGVAAGSTKVIAKAVSKAKTYKLTCKVKVQEVFPEYTWVSAKDPSVEGGVKEKFDTLNKNNDGASFEPVATLSFKVDDSGTAWRVLCKQTLVLANPISVYVIAEIKEAMDGTVSLVNVYKSSVNAYPSADSGLSGGWTECESPKLTADEKKVFNAATADLVGVNYKPIAKVATQVVAGLNYCFICESTAVVMNPKTRYSFVYVYSAVDGTSTVSSVETIDVADDTGMDLVTGPGGGAARSGGYQKPDSPEVDATLRSYVEKAAAGISKDIIYTPLALIGVRENDGQDYRVFCKRTAVRPGAKSTYSILDIHANLIGDVVVADIIDTGIEAYGTGEAAAWTEAESPVISKGEGAYFDEAVKGLVGVKFTPLAILATEKIRGTNYCFIADATTVSDNPANATVLFYFSVGEDGKVTYQTTVDLLNAATDSSFYYRSGDVSAILGTWSYENTFTYTFKSDGTGQYKIADEVFKITYSVDGNNLTVKLIDQPAPNEYTIPYKVSGNTLTITDAAGNSVVYTRV